MMKQVFKFYINKLNNKTKTNYKKNALPQWSKCCNLIQNIHKVSYE